MFKLSVYGGLRHPLPGARSVVGWIDGSDRPSYRQVTRASGHSFLPLGLPARENPAQVAVEWVWQWPDVIWGPVVLGVKTLAPRNNYG